MIWDVIGNVSNAVAAVSAVTAIGITVRNMTERLTDLYSQIINQSMRYKTVSAHFDQRSFPASEVI